MTSPLQARTTSAGACQSAEQTPLAQRLFGANNAEYDTFVAMLDRPPSVNPGLQDLFAHAAPWDQ